MTHARYELGATATYTRRTALWVAGAGTGDGALVLTVYRKNKLPHSACYWVEVTDGRVMVWESGGGERKRYYAVTPDRCSCDGMLRSDAPPCKHHSAVSLLIRENHLRHPAWRGKPHGRQVVDEERSGAGERDGGRCVADAVPLARPVPVLPAV